MDEYVTDNCPFVLDMARDAEAGRLKGLNGGWNQYGGSETAWSIYKENDVTNSGRMAAIIGATVEYFLNHLKRLLHQHYWLWHLQCLDQMNQNESEFKVAAAHFLC